MAENRDGTLPVDQTIDRSSICSKADEREFCLGEWVNQIGAQNCSIWGVFYFVSARSRNEFVEEDSYSVYLAARPFCTSDDAALHCQSAPVEVPASGTVPPERGPIETSS